MCCGMENFCAEDRERGEPEGEREMQVGAAQKALYIIVFQDGGDGRGYRS